MASFFIDTGLLSVRNTNPLDAKRLSGGNCDVYLNELSTAGVQFLMDTLFKLPFESIEDGRIALLPEPETVLPREKPIPAKRMLTTWDKFAQRKGIKSKKRDRLQFDESNEDWRPRYGSKRANKESDQWCIEHKDSLNTEDPWAKMKADKKTRVEKNRSHQVKNLEAAQGRRLPGTIDLASATGHKAKGAAKEKKGHVEVAFKLASSSTASMGVFDKKSSNMEPGKDSMKLLKAQTAGKKQDRSNVKSEKESNLKLLGRILKSTGDRKGAELDKNKAANLQKSKTERKKQRSKK